LVVLTLLAFVELFFDSVFEFCKDVNQFQHCGVKHDECVICLEKFNPTTKIIKLPCHCDLAYHPECFEPWGKCTVCSQIPSAKTSVLEIKPLCRHFVAYLVLHAILSFFLLLIDFTLLDFKLAQWLESSLQEFKTFFLYRILFCVDIWSFFTKN
jgi:hypothetical protein